MKYIIEIKPEYEDSFKGVMILGARDSNLFVDVAELDNLEELNSDYINEHYGELQDTAYQRGLEDAWEVAKKLFSTMADSDIEKAFPTEWNNGGFNALINLQPQEAIEKLKAYEEKQKADDEIKVGDEVNWIGDCFIVTRIFQPRTQKEQCDGIDDDGCVYHDVLMNDLEKTGRHFDIHKILKEMKE